MIQWIDSENNYISPNTQTDSIIGICINGKEYYDEGDGEICVHINALREFKCKELPPNRPIIPAVSFNKSFINQGDFFCELLLNGEYLYCIVPYEVEPDDYTEKININEKVLFNEVYKSVYNKGYCIQEFEDKKNYKFIRFSFYVDANMDIEYAIKYMQEEIKTIFGNISQARDFSQFDEENFTIQCVIPALKNKGLLNVRYEHGISEYGKDIVYQYIDNFGILRYGAAQVKAGNISGKADGKLKTIIEQIELAFLMPYLDIVAKMNVYIEQVVVICSGMYTNNAKEIIYKKFEKNKSVIFLDGQDISKMLD